MAELLPLFCEYIVALMNDFKTLPVANEISLDKAVGS